MLSAHVPAAQVSGASMKLWQMPATPCLMIHPDTTLETFVYVCPVESGRRQH